MDFISLNIHFFIIEHPSQMKMAKFRFMKLFIISHNLLISTNFDTLCSFWLAFEHNWGIWLLKISFRSKVIPSNFSLLLSLMIVCSIFISIPSCCAPNTTMWHFSLLSFIKLSCNQFDEITASFSNLYKTLVSSSSLV